MDVREIVFASRPAEAGDETDDGAATAQGRDGG